MLNITELKDRIFSIQPESFTEITLEVFRLQARHVPVYADYLSLLNIKPEAVEKVEDIPFLPIQLFKSHDVIWEGQQPETIFESSRTTGSIPSRHLVSDTSLYIRSLSEAFRLFWGAPEDYVFLSLLPAYAERQGSSLVYMMEYLHQQSGDSRSGFYLYEHRELARRLEELMREGKKIFFTGVSFALLDFAAEYPVKLENAVIMETGGMKGRRTELVREELHGILKEAFGLEHIASEYGMTELLSQAYARTSGAFETPPWMRFVIREANDPFTLAPSGQSGGINIIDLANLYSCSFIATQDLGRELPGGQFEVLGRYDAADVRGCSLMYL